MRTSLFVVFLLVYSTFAIGQDCNPCIAVDQLLIISPTEKSDTLSKLMSGTTIGLYVQLDNARIIRVDPDFTRILNFSDDKKMDLLKKGAQIERTFAEEMKEMDLLMSGGINIDNSRISEDGHAVSIPIHTMAKPTDGAQTIFLEGQIGLRIKTDITEEVPVKNVQLSSTEMVTVKAKGVTIELTPERQEDLNGQTVYIFSYYPANEVLGIHQSASSLTDVTLRENEFFTTTLDKTELIIELPNIKLMEVPFTLKFGLGL